MFYLKHYFIIIIIMHLSYLTPKDLFALGF